MVKSAFRNFLNTQFGYCHENALPTNAHVDLVIDEVEINLYKLTSACPEDLTFDELGERFRRRMKSVQERHQGLAFYVCLFDEKEFVPEAKHPTQRERAAASRKAGKAPFTPDEAKTVQIGRGAEVPAPRRKFWEKLIITSSLRDEFNSFCAREIIKTPFAPLVEQDEEDVVRIVIDSVRISEKGFNEAEIVLENATEDDFASDNTFVLQCVPPTVENSAKCVKMESTKTGESDLKVPWWISQLRRHDVLVRTTDTDTLLILLLNMRSWISQQTSCFESNIYVEMTGDRQTNEGSIVDMCSLWRSIMTHFRNNFPNVTNPIETVALFYLLCKTDYTDTFSQLGYTKLWQAFVARGQNILYDNAGGPGAIIMDNVWGDDARECPRYVLRMGEDRVYHFLEYAWHRILINRKRKTAEVPPCMMEAIREMARIKNAQLVEDRKKTFHAEMMRLREKNVEGKYKEQEGKINKPYYEIPSDEEIYARIRRILWSLDYFMNGYKEGKYAPPLDRENGLSKWGWESVIIDEESKRAQTERAKRTSGAGEFLAENGTHKRKR